MPGNNYAYATLLTSDSYLPGALVLASSLRAAFAQYPLIVLVTENGLSENALSALGRAYDRIVTVPLLRSSDAGNLELLGRTELDVTYTKLHVFNPQVTGADKVAFFDADAFATRNVDAIFDYVQGDVVFAAAPDIGWPDCFNSGVFVATPRADIFQALVRAAATSGSFDGGDQGVLNDYFSGWASGVPRPGPSSSNHKTARLPFTYNVTPTSFYSYLPALKRFQDDISVVHFIGAQKPWKGVRESDAFGGPEGPMQQFLTRWWNFYDAVKHVLNRPENATRTHTTSSRPVVQHNNWTASGAQQNKSSNSGSSGGNGGSSSTPSADASEFSNYRVAWDEHEASPVRSHFSMTQAPFIVTYRAMHNGASDAAFFETAEPTALFPNAEEDLTPVSAENAPGSARAGRRPSFAEFEKEVSKHYTESGPPPSDLGNYRVGWNEAEVGPVAGHLSETPGHCGIGGENPHWHTMNTDLTKTSVALSGGGLRSPSSGGAPHLSDSDHDQDDDDVVEDDRVWNEDGDQEEFVRSLKAPRVRSASAGSSKSANSGKHGAHQQAPVAHTAPQQQQSQNKTARGALGPLTTSK
ncbi:hypothetical protein HDU88_007552 [Geranomyces variabilis]|nr:hypothetical protein HDU88_007552 [Geranomyces variabilis]